MMTLKEEVLHVWGLLQKAVADKGAEYVYRHKKDIDQEPCAYLEYTSEGPYAPSCLVGHVYVYDGVPTENIVGLEGLSPEESEIYHGKVNSALGDVQTAQDQGTPWGEAILLFRNAFPEIIKES